MKMIESKFTSNIDLKQSYPNIFKYIEDNTVMKFVKKYAINNTDIILADTYECVLIFMINFNRRINDREINLAVNELFGEEADYEINRDIINHLKYPQVAKDRGVKDFLLIKHLNK